MRAFRGAKRDETIRDETKQSGRDKKVNVHNMLLCNQPDISFNLESTNRSVYAESYRA